MTWTLVLLLGVALGMNMVLLLGERVMLSLLPESCLTARASIRPPRKGTGTSSPRRGHLEVLGVLARDVRHPSGGIFPVCPNICEKQNRLRKFIDVVILVTDSALSCSSP